MKTYGSTTKTSSNNSKPVVTPPTEKKVVREKPVVTKEKKADAPKERAETKTPPQKKQKKPLDRKRSVRLRQISLLAFLFLTVLLFGILSIIRFSKTPSTIGIQATMIDYKVVQVEDETKDVYISKEVIAPVYDYIYDNKEYTVNGVGDVTFKSTDDANSSIGKKFDIYLDKKDAGHIFEKKPISISGVIFMAIAVIALILFTICAVYFYKDNMNAKRNKKSDDVKKEKKEPVVVKKEQVAEI